MIPRYRAWNKATKAMYEVDDIMSIDFGKSKISVKTLFNFERLCSIANSREIIGNIYTNPGLLEVNS